MTYRRNPLAQARVDHLLGTVMQAADEQEMITYRSAATKSCMSYKGLVARQIPRRFYEIPYIGAGAIERQLEIRQRELEEVRQHLTALDQAERALPLLARAEEESGQAVRAWRDAYPELSEAAEARLAALMQEAHGERSMEERLQSYESSRRGNETRRDNMWQQLLVARERYGLEHGDTGHVYDPDHAYYAQIHARLAATDIPAFEEKAREALAQSEMEFKAHFIFSMREAIESTRHEFRDLNYSLDQFQFHKDKYSFLITPSAKYKPFYDAVMTADWEMAGGLFAETDAAANEQAMELFEKLVKGTPEEQEEFSDYRRYLDYDIRITDTAGQSYLYSRVLRQT